MKYAVVIERAEDGLLWAYVPDLPGCTSNGETMDAVRSNVRDAIELHLNSLRRHNEPVPPPSARVLEVEAA